MKNKFIIDTDTATDDAVALIMAMKNESIKIEAITVVAGNVELEKGVQNALYTISLCDQELPVYAGMDKPLLRPLKTAYHVHGNDGLGGIGLEPKNFKAKEKHAVQILIEKINENPGEITLVCMAPLTNIAAAIQLDKSIVHKLKKCVIMGGVGQGRGNITPISEYNIWADPEAAKIVFESGIPIRMVGWDISRDFAVFEEEDSNQIKAIGTPLADFALSIQATRNEFTKKMAKLEGFDLPDPIAMAIAIDESIATEIKKAHVTILTNDDYSRGQTAIDYIGITGYEPNAEIVLQADRAKFIAMLHKSLQ
ncbi:nucleoside hydrolase [Cellulophaga baltica]|uniref:nucleoside hydrolase n=1 Tax=Cellulophaga TaxID=104264 RepID=UPI001C0768E4|nr:MULTISPECIES: nucleoside hydrolase [Cellulophaga]MBU2996665.1 nucleoside hydrolase [Cellulophaga baltica]MDO6768059.1 nucleoside hydrolase [Cellulophaga sp. 1_MG-2023]